MNKYFSSTQKSFSKFVKNIKKQDFLNNKRNQAILDAAVVAIVAGTLGILAVRNDKPTPVVTAEQTKNDGSVLGSSTSNTSTTTSVKTTPKATTTAAKTTVAPAAPAPAPQKKTVSTTLPLISVSLNAALPAVQATTVSAKLL